MKKLLVIALVLSLCGIASANEWRGENYTTGEMWSIDGNWEGGQPTISEEASINRDRGLCILDVARSVKKLNLGGDWTHLGGGTDVLEITTGGSLVVTYGSAVVIGVNSSGSGTLIMSGGTFDRKVTVAALFAGAYGSNGDITMNSGLIETDTFAIAHKTSGPTISGGHVQLNGGTIRAANNFLMNKDHCTSTGTMQAAGGTLEYWDNNAASSTAMDHYIAQGWITAAGGESVIVEYVDMGGAEHYLYTYLNKRIRLYATPEPATLALLGLGGLALIRRKK